MSWGGLGPERTSKNFTRLFQRWGSRSNLRAILNYCIPVTIVDRFRHDSEGSLYGMYCQTGSAPGQHPAVMFGNTNTTNDLEILGFECWYRWTNAVGIFDWPSFGHLFTPVLPYNPITTITPIGYAIPGLITSEAFTRPSTVGLMGVSPAMPAYPGWTGWVWHQDAKQSFVGINNFWWSLTDHRHHWFPERPLRLISDTTVCWQLNNPRVGDSLALGVSILFRELRNYD